MELITLRRSKRKNLFASDREVMQRVVIAVHRKLTTHLRGHERMGHPFLVKICIQVWKVQSYVVTHNHYGSTCGKCGIHIHHAGIEAIAGVCCHLVTRFEVVVTLIPMAETYKIAMLQLTALRLARRTRGIKQDEEAIRLE